MWWRLKSPASRLFAQSFSCADLRKHQNPATLGLCEGNPPVTSEFPSQMGSNAEFLCFLWWRHHDSLQVMVSRWPPSPGTSWAASLWTKIPDMIWGSFNWKITREDLNLRCEACQQEHHSVRLSNRVNCHASSPNNYILWLFAFRNILIPEAPFTSMD